MHISVCMYAHGTYVCNSHAQVIEAENSVTLNTCTSTTTFIALRCPLQVIMDFAYEYTYQAVTT